MLIMILKNRRKIVKKYIHISMALLVISTNLRAEEGKTKDFQECDRYWGPFIEETYTALREIEQRQQKFDSFSLREEKTRLENQVDELNLNLNDCFKTGLFQKRNGWRIPYL